jgi:anti-sigma B factor antagonist
MIAQGSTLSMDGDITVFAITGRLNLGNTLISIEDSLKGLIADGTRRLVIDLTGLSGIDSSGIGMLMLCGGETRNQGGSMRITGTHDSVKKIFEIVHLSRVIPIDPDIETSCQNLK